MSDPIENTPAFGYSMALNLNDQPCLVVGGGKVAVRKIQRLLAAGAAVVVIAPDMDARILAMPAVQCLQRPFQIEDIANIDPLLVILCSNDKALHERTSAYCHAHRILVNVADDRAQSTFIVQSSFQKEDLLVSVSTNGTNPGFAKYLREHLEASIDPQVLVAMEMLSRLRTDILTAVEGQEQREAILRTIDIEALIAKLRERPSSEVESELRTCLFS